MKIIRLKILPHLPEANELKFNLMRALLTVNQLVSVLKGCLNIKMLCCLYRNSHVKDKTVSWPSYLLHGSPHTWKDSLYIEMGHWWLHSIEYQPWALIFSLLSGLNVWLTHWGRMMHICIGNLTTIGSDNGLAPHRRQAIIWTNAGILLIRTLGTNFNEMLIEIKTFSFKKMHFKMLSVKFCLGLNVLNKMLIGWWN